MKWFLPTLLVLLVACGSGVERAAPTPPARTELDVGVIVGRRGDSPGGARPVQQGDGLHTCRDTPITCPAFVTVAFVAGGVRDVAVTDECYTRTEIGGPWPSGDPACQGMPAGADQ